MVGASLLSFLLLATCASATRVPDRFIVELDSLEGLTSKRLYSSPHDALYHGLRKRGIPFDVRTQYDTKDIFVGASLALSSQDKSQLASIPGVKAIHPVVTVSSHKPINRRVVEAAGASLPDGESTHVMTGVDKVHAQGLTGTGIKIGIIDTGVDYNHPFLGGGIGPGHKIVGGYDLVGDNYTGLNDPQPDPDPLDQCNGHGTHVTGIIGANPGNPFNISGVAYGATLSMYRIFGCTGDTTDDVIIDALLRGYEDGNDVLTLSLGGPDGWLEGASGVVASRIAGKGRVVTIAAGNDGQYGAWYTSSPGTGKDVISVASIDNIVIPVQNATLHGVSHDPISYLSANALPVNGTLAVYATSTNSSVADDACDTLPDSTPDLSDKVVIVRRGTCTFAQKLQNIANKGGKVALIYNNVEGWTSITAGNFTAALISAEEGAYLVREFASHANISLSFPSSGAATIADTLNGGLVSSFSSYGPSYDMQLKPALAAPGGNILSTYPLPLGAWALDSGTSMATPFVAGAAALLLQARGKGAAKGMRGLLQATANPVRESLEEGALLQTAAQQGSGLIQVDSALGTKTVVTPAQLLLNDTAHFHGWQKFTVKNTDTKSVTYKLSHVPAGTALTYEPDSIFAADGPVNLTHTHARVHLSSAHITLPPGGSAVITATFTPPRLSASTLPVYSGFITLTSTTETLRVAYLGAVGDLHARTVLDTTDAFFGYKLPALWNATGGRQVGVQTYDLGEDDQPSVIGRLAFGSPLVRADLVPADFKLPVHARRGLLDAVRGNNTALAGVRTLGALAEFDYVPRSSDAPDADDNGWTVVPLNGTFVDGSRYGDGAYRVLVRALRVNGDRHASRDYDMALTGEFVVKEKKH
ncbi:peptidase S8 family domain-containing protein [Phanerochaete sordida]|uniref:Peptidase S8 family domain-containing protein n=1 Tax=Phanerochaete sordida TaxID=48140 RepID=A0A9P3GFJ7_9APHY|nr:peptidase S8 family domain-containing protein [Phanerochaete sordida]